MALKRTRKTRKSRKSSKRNRRRKHTQKGGANVPLLLNATTLPLPTESFTFEVTLGGTPLTTDGPTLKQEQTEAAPIVQWDPKPATVYTLIAWDPDAPASPWLHWLATNLSGPADSFPDAKVAWAAATPPQGVHRYIVGLFEQTQGHIDPQTPPQRGNFPLKTFVEQNNLTLVAYKGFRVRAPRPPT